MPKGKDWDKTIARLLEDIDNLMDQYRELANRTPEKPDNCQGAG